MQVQYSSQNALYRSSIHCAVSLIRNYGLWSFYFWFKELNGFFQKKGIRGIYQGYSVTLVRNIPGCMIYFYSYDQTSRVLVKRSNSAESDHKYHSSQRSSLQVLTAGGVAGTVYWITIFPIDVIKSNMQIDHSDWSKRQFKGFLDAVTKIYRQRGIKAFYKGLTPCLIRSFPTNAATFLAYEYTRSLLDRVI